MQEQGDPTRVDKAAEIGPIAAGFGSVWPDNICVPGIERQERILNFKGAPKPPEGKGGGGKGGGKGGKGSGLLGMFPTLEDFVAMPGPRILKSHLHRRMFMGTSRDADCIASGSKVVYVARNIFDAMASCYSFKGGFVGFMSAKEAGVPFDAFAKLYMSGKVGFGSWMENVKGWYQEAKQNPDQCLFVRFEDLKADPEAVVKRIADFMGLSPSQDVINDVVKYSGFDHMKSKAEERDVAAGGDGSASNFFRQGKVGGDSNLFNTRIVEEIREIYTREMGDLDPFADIDLNYGT